MSGRFPSGRRHWVALAVLCAIASLVMVPAGAGAATAGSLDASFGTGGSGFTSLATGTALNGVAVGPDGAVTGLGVAGPSLLVARFSPAGSLQSTFAAGSGVGRAVAVSPDGKIVVAGYDSAGMLVERFNADGSRDTGFGFGGVVRTVSGGRANALALGPGGTIVAAGQVPGADSFQRIAVVRLHADGSPDSSFGANGVDVVDLGQDSVAKGVAVQGDGKIVLAGSAGPGAHQIVNAFVARLTPSGPLDKSFGTGLTGVFFQYPVGGGGAVTLNAVTLDPAGAIVAAGGGSGQTGPQALFERLTCAGTPDPSFGGSGLVLTPASRTFIGDPLGANGVAVGPGREVVGAGEYQDSGLRSASLWGFASTGTPSFTTIAPSNGAQASALTLDSAGNFVVAGSFSPPGFSSSGFVARYVGSGPPGSGGSPCGGLAPPPPPPPSPPPPPPPPPSVTTGPVSSVTVTGAMLSGSVNPNGTASAYHFDYGTSTTYGAQTAATSAGSGTAAVAASAGLSGLKSGTVYHYRLAAASTAGAAFGADQTFRTATLPTPTITHFTQSHRTWVEPRSRRHKRPVGTTFAFSLNVPARVHLAFFQRVSGRKVHRRCVARTRRNSRQVRCNLTVSKGTVDFTGHPGENRFRFVGRISRSHKLKPGRYVVAITATSAVGQRSRRRSLSFTIVR